MKLDEALKTMQQAGYRVTSPRRVVVEAALSYDRYFTAAEVEQQLIRAGPGIGRATIFRTLERLVSLGLLARVNAGPARGYTLCGARDHHHHLICSGCGAVVKVSGCLVEEQIAQLSTATAFRIDGHYVEYYGLCAECQAGGPNRRSGVTESQGDLPRRNKTDPGGTGEA